MEIDLSPVRKLYRKVVSVQEYYHPDLKWTNILKDGADVKSNDDRKYDRLGLEGVVLECIKSGATQIQFLCRNDKAPFLGGDPNKWECFPDYKVEELIKL